MFRLLQSNHNQAVYQTYKKEIILHIESRRDLYTNSVQPDCGCFGVAATYSLNPQWLFRVVH
jgi:hypothetical protein